MGSYTKKWISILLVVWFSIINIGCNQKEKNREEGAIETRSIQPVTIFGEVKNDKNTSIANILVKLLVDLNGNGLFEKDEIFAAETDEAGFYSIAITQKDGLDGEILKKSIDIEVVCDVNGWLPTSKSWKISSPGTYRKDIALFKGSVGTIKNSYTKVDVDTGDIEDNESYVSISFKDPVPDGWKAHIAYINPLSRQQAFDGDFFGIAQSSNTGGLVSSGMIKVVVTDEKGDAQELNDRNITIRYPFPKNLWSQLSDEDPWTESIDVPLWWYDKDIGSWVQSNRIGYIVTEDGKVVSNTKLINIIDGNFSDGPLFIEGNVTHFSSWNADVAYPQSGISGHIEDENGDGVGSGEVCDEDGYCIPVEIDGDFFKTENPGHKDSLRDLLKFNDDMLKKAIEKARKYGGAAGSDPCESVRDIVSRNYKNSIDIVKKDMRNIIMDKNLNLSDSTKNSLLFWYKQFSNDSKAGHYDKAQYAIKRFAENLPYSSDAKEWGGNSVAYTTAQDLQDLQNVLLDTIPFFESSINDILKINITSSPYLNQCSSELLENTLVRIKDFSQNVFTSNQEDWKSKVADGYKAQIPQTMKDYISIVADKNFLICMHGYLKAYASKEVLMSFRKWGGNFAAAYKKVSAITILGADSFNTLFNFYKLTKPRAFAMEQWRKIEDDRHYFVQNATKLIRHVQNNQNIPKICRDQIVSIMNSSMPSEGVSARSIELRDMGNEETAIKEMEDFTRFVAAEYPEMKEIYENLYGIILGYRVHQGILAATLGLAGNFEKYDDWVSRSGNRSSAPNPATGGSKRVKLYWKTDDNNYVPLYDHSIGLPNYTWFFNNHYRPYRDIGAAKVHVKPIIIKVVDGDGKPVRRKVFHCDTGDVKFAKVTDENGIIKVFASNKTKSITILYRNIPIKKISSLDSSKLYIVTLDYLAKISSVDILSNQNRSLQIAVNFVDIRNDKELSPEKVKQNIKEAKLIRLIKLSTNHNVLEKPIEIDLMSRTLNISYENGGRYLAVFETTNREGLTLSSSFPIQWAGKPTLKVAESIEIVGGGLTEWSPGNYITLKIDAEDNSTRNKVSYRWSTCDPKSNTIFAKISGKNSNTFMFVPYFKVDYMDEEGKYHKKFKVSVEVSNDNGEVYNRSIDLNLVIKIEPDVRLENLFLNYENGRVQAKASYIASTYNSGITMPFSINDVKLSIPAARTQFSKTIGFGGTEVTGKINIFGLEQNRTYHGNFVITDSQKHQYMTELNLTIPSLDMRCIPSENNTTDFQCSIKGAKEDNISWSYDGLTWENGGKVHSITLPHYGPYSIVAKIDLSDNITAEVTDRVQKLPNIHASCSCNFDAVNHPPLSVIFSLGKNVDRSAIEYILFNPYGYGGEEMNVTDTPASFTFTYEEPGFYNPFATIVYKDGTISQVYFSNVPLLVAPLFSVSLNANKLSGPPPLRVEFSAEVENNLSAIVQYEWDFDGDGIIDSNTTINKIVYVYKEEGTYRPSVIVKDTRDNTVHSRLNGNINVGKTQATIYFSDGLKPASNIPIYQFDTDNPFILLQESATDSEGAYRPGNVPAAIGYIWRRSDDWLLYYIKYIQKPSIERILMPHYLHTSTIFDFTGINNVSNIYISGSNGNDYFATADNNKTVVHNISTRLDANGTKLQADYLLCYQAEPLLRTIAYNHTFCYLLEDINVSEEQNSTIEVAKLTNSLPLYYLNTEINTTENNLNATLDKIFAMIEGEEFAVPFQENLIPYSDRFQKIEFVYKANNSDIPAGWLDIFYEKDRLDASLDRNNGTLTVRFNAGLKHLFFQQDGTALWDEVHGENYKASVIENQTNLAYVEDSDITFAKKLKIVTVDGVTWTLNKNIVDIPTYIDSIRPSFTINSFEVQNDVGTINVSYDLQGDGKECDLKLMGDSGNGTSIYLSVDNLPFVDSTFTIDRFGLDEWLDPNRPVAGWINCCDRNGSCLERGE